MINADIIQGVKPEWIEDLGLPRRRDPDALPPRNLFESLLSHIYKGTVAMRGGNTLFALKAAVLTGTVFKWFLQHWSNLLRNLVLSTVLLCIPSFLRSSGSFAYSEKLSTLRFSKPDRLSTSCSSQIRLGSVGFFSNNTG